jgi:ABC-type lipoprotein release transport system permease subunit
LISGDGSVSDEKLAQAIAAVIPSSYKTETLTGAEITKETQDQIGSALSFFNILLSTFSYIALGVGSFVIYNVFSISAAQRQRENALLRAIGASKKQVTRAMLIESVVVGLFGSAIGLFAGIGLSKGTQCITQCCRHRSSDRWARSAKFSSCQHHRGWPHCHRGIGLASCSSRRQSSPSCCNA